METPSTVKRKATIDLTRSDSEDEPPKQRRRVIEIESDDDDDEAPVPTTTVPPWETPEWKAHCAKERAHPILGFSLLDSIRASNGEPEIDTCSDEEMWRKIHDPVGAERMRHTRVLEAQGLTELLSTDYVERKVAKFARELEEKRRVDSEA